MVNEDQLSSMEELSSAPSASISEEQEETSSAPVLSAPADQEELQAHLENIETVVSHPFFTTVFADYTVSEGISLLILLVLLLSFLIKCIKEAFSWL